MQLGATRRVSIVVAVLLTAAMLVALAASSAHADHGCLVDRQCPACRWAAESLVLAPDPPDLPVPEGTEFVSPAETERPAQRVGPPPRSRAPPRG